jgi:hypothetical protein
MTPAIMPARRYAHPNANHEPRAVSGAPPPLPHRPDGWPSRPASSKAHAATSSKERIDVTGARLGRHSAEAVLKLRASISNGDVDTYWTHLTQEQQRVHNARDLNGLIPTR